MDSFIKKISSGELWNNGLSKILSNALSDNEPAISLTNRDRVMYRIIFNPNIDNINKITDRIGDYIQLFVEKTSKNSLSMNDIQDIYTLFSIMMCTMSPNVNEGGIESIYSDLEAMFLFYFQMFERRAEYSSLIDDNFKRKYDKFMEYINTVNKKNELINELKK